MTADSSVGGGIVIWGPSLGSGRIALDTVRALYYLPLYITLILPIIPPDQQARQREVMAVVAHYGLGGRVRFSDKHIEAEEHIVVATRADGHPGHVYGASPEALASAIFDVVRARAR